LKKYKLIFIFLYYFFSGLHFRNQPDMHHHPLASFSILSQIYSQQPKPAKPNVTDSVSTAVSSPRGEKQKIKITIVTKKTSAAPPPTSSAPMSHVPVPPVPVPPVHASPSPVSPRTRKIKITIKKQPQEQEQEQPQKQPQKQPQEQPQKQPQEQPQKQPQKQCFIDDIAPPSSMIYNPCGDYIAPPPKCCRFFIDNHHCFLRSTDNACIDPISKIVFGFWNCEIGAKCKLLPVDDDTVYEEVCEEKEKKDFFCNNHEDDDYNDDNHGDDIDDIKMRAEMRKKSDANRARLTGQPIALLRQKIAIKYGMQIRSIPTK